MPTDAPGPHIVTADQISDAEHGEQVRARLAAFAAATPGTRERAYAMGRIHAYASDDLARLLARAEAAEAKLARLRGTWLPGRWWRAIDAEGALLCESSNEAEVRSMARPGDRVQNLFEYGTAEWRDA